MADIFLSYASEDRDRVAPIANFLKNHGWTVFWDVEIPPGQTWRNFISNELSSAQCAIVIWSRHSVNKDWVLEEVEEAKNQGKKILPLRLDDVEPPFGFRMVQAALIEGGPNSTIEYNLKPVLEVLSGWLGQPHYLRSKSSGTELSLDSAISSIGVDESAEKVVTEKSETIESVVPDWPIVARTMAYTFMVVFVISILAFGLGSVGEIYRPFDFGLYTSAFLLSGSIGVLIGCNQWFILSKGKLLRILAWVAAGTVFGGVGANVAFLIAREAFDLDLIIWQVREALHVSLFTLGALLATQRVHGLMLRHSLILAGSTALGGAVGGISAAIAGQLDGQFNWFGIFGFGDFLFYGGLALGFLFGIWRLSTRRLGRFDRLRNLNAFGKAAFWVALGAGIGDLVSYVPWMFYLTLRDQMAMISEDIEVLRLLARAFGSGFDAVGIVLGLAFASRQLTGRNVYTSNSYKPHA